MSGAIGVAPGDRKAAVGKVLLQRVADRPSALDFANLRKRDPPHLAHFGSSVHPSVHPRLFAGNGGHASPRARNRPSPGRLSGASVRVRVVGARACAPWPPGRLRPRRLQADRTGPPLSFTPIRLALPMTALRDGGPAPRRSRRRSYLRWRTASVTRCSVPSTSPHLLFCCCHKNLVFAASSPCIMGLQSVFTFSALVLFSSMNLSFHSVVGTPGAYSKRIR